MQEMASGVHTVHADEFLPLGDEVLLKVLSLGHLSVHNQINVLSAQPNRVNPLAHAHQI